MLSISDYARDPMPNQEVLESIRKAEENAEKIIQDAHTKKSETIEAAKKTSLKMLTEANEEMQKKADKELADFKKQLEIKKQEFIEKSRKASSELKKNASKNVDKASSFLAEKFMKLP